LNLARAVRVALLLSVGPVLALVALDRAIVGWQGQWAWAAREVPPLTLDPYRVEGILRSTPPGRQNVLLLGNSITEKGFDSAALEQRFADRGLRFPKLVIGGSPALTFGMLARPIAALEPSLVLLVVAPPSLRSAGYEDHVFTYDALEVPELYTAHEWLANPRFHIEGVAQQLNVLARHRRSMQRAALVWLGIEDWEDVERAAAGLRVEHMLGGADQFQTWLKEPTPDAYPNPNTRALGVLAARLRERGSRLLVMEAPVHPIQALLIPPERLAAAHEELERLAGEDGFALVTQAELPALEERDFTDWVHASARGRKRLTAFLADYLARTL